MVELGIGTRIRASTSMAQEAAEAIPKRRRIYLWPSEQSILSLLAVIQAQLRHSTCQHRAGQMLMVIPEVGKKVVMVVLEAVPRANQAEQMAVMASRMNTPQVELVREPLPKNSERKTAACMHLVAMVIKPSPQLRIVATERMEERRVTRLPPKIRARLVL